MEADFKDDILENEWALKKSPNENERWNFSQTESVFFIIHLSFQLVPCKFVRKWRVLLKPSLVFIP